jgi:6-phosphogluconolactonase (cycloisomerase 2 family)
MNLAFIRGAFAIVVSVGTIGLAGCGGGSGSGSSIIGGKVSGLSGSGLLLQDNGGDTLSVAASGAFTFKSEVSSGSAYNVTVATQPTKPTQTCIVRNGTGTANGSAITNVAISCKTNSYTVGGTVSGLPDGQSLTFITQPGPGIVTVQRNGPFTFGSPLLSGTAYGIVFAAGGSLGPQYTCTIQNSSGTVFSSNVTNIVVTCTQNKYTLSVVVSGLTGSGLVLTTFNGTSETLQVTSNGTFSFPSPVSVLTSVAVATQPSNPSETCQPGGAGLPNANNVIQYTVTCNPDIYTVGGTVTGLQGSGLVLTNVAAYAEVANPPVSTLPVSANGAFVFPTPLASGAQYQVNVTTQPTNPSQTCVVDDGVGVIANASVSLTVICAIPRFAYGAGGHGNDVLAYTLDITSGALTAIAGSPYPAGDSTSAVAVDPSNRFLYATNQGATGGPGSNTVSAYTINSVTGALSAVAGSPFASVASPVAIAVEPTGHFAYVANLHDNTVSAFTINLGTGALSAIAGGPSVPGGDGPRHLSVHPSGKFLYLSVGNEATLWAYSIDPSTGALAPVPSSPFQAPTAPGTLAISPNGLYGYISGAHATFSNLVGTGSSYTILPNTGSLVPTNGFGFGGVTSLAMESGGNFVYILYQPPSGNGYVLPCTVFIPFEGNSSFVSPKTDKTGHFLSFTFPDRISTITADPSGRFLYVVDTFGTAWAFTINSTTGNLTLGAKTPHAFSAQQPLVITKQ